MSILIFIIIIGVLLYLVNSVIPMPDWVKTCANVVGAVMIVIELLRWLGAIGGFYI